MKILIKNGWVIDPANNLDGVFDILIEDSRISRVAKHLFSHADKLINARDKIVMPGMVDMHVHLRQPGREDKETIASGTQASLKGGITTLLAMPNTTPAADTPENLRLVRELIKREAGARVFICGAVTLGRVGKKLTVIAKLKKAGAVAISDDGASVDSAHLLEQALREAKKAGLLLICHCEDRALSGKGVVNLGFISTKLGLMGIPKEAEYKRVERDIKLAEKTKAPLHIAHVSCQESVEIIARAKKKRIKVTCDTCPHYFSLTEEQIGDYNTNLKINPPLRTKEDVLAIKEGLKRGVIDAIASDHAPHTENEKEVEFEHAEFGTIGLETMLAVSITELLKPGILDWSELVRKLSFYPARILGLDRGSLNVGKDADIIIVDPQKKWRVKKEEIVSKSKNCAFLDRELWGLVEYTICGGKIVYAASSHQRIGPAG